MSYNPNIHNRRSIRLKGYDYSQAGMYYITICIKDRAFFFGKIENGEMILNDAGEMINKWWQKIPEKFPDIVLDVYQIMPNHFHAITINNGSVVVGADPCVCPKNIGEQTHLGEHMGSPLHRIVQWFKTMTTNGYIRGVKNMEWTQFNGKLWQRNYWEHIIRNEQSYKTISNYIINNPSKWNEDKFHKQ